MSSAPRDPREPNLHRNNAAEWVMVGMIYPLRIAYRIWAALRKRWTGHS